MVERPDGSHVSAMVHIDPVKDPAGNVIGAVNCFYDTAHRERTGELARSQAAAAAGRQMLQEQSRRFATTYEHAMVGIAEVDAGGRRIGVNEAACAITGRSRAELIGGNIFHVLHVEDRDDDFDQYQRLVAGEIDRYSIEKRIVRKDGRVIWVAVTSSSVRDAAGKFVYGVRIFEDITERKVAEDKLRERERQFRELLEGLPPPSMPPTRSAGSHSTITPWSSWRVVGPSSAAANGPPPGRCSGRTARRYRTINHPWRWR